MAFSDWIIYTRTNVSNVDNVFGVYELSNSKTKQCEITYIGRGKLHNELKRYLQESCTEGAMYFRYEETSSDERAQERERALLRDFKDKCNSLPKCNERIG